MNARLPSPRGARRALGWTLAAVLGLLALSLRAWLASNWADAPARPRPPALQLPAAAVSESRNAHDALAGVLALPEADPAQQARDERGQVEQWVALPLSERMSRAANLAKGFVPVTRQPLPRGAPWYCPEGRALCASAWLTEHDALAHQRDGLAWGARCDALSDGELAIEEHVPQPLRQGGVIAQHITGANACMRWFLTGAALAFVDGDAQALERDLARADRFNRALLAGNRSLIATLFSGRTGHTLLDLAATLAVRDAELAARLQALLAGWPEQAAQARRWILHEANFGVSALTEDFDCCAAPSGALGAVAEGWDWSDRLQHALTQAMCRHGIGIHRQRTLDYADARWLERLAVLDAGGLAALDRFSQTPQGGHTGGLTGSMSGGLHWRNTFGAMMVDIGAETYGEHVRRQRDLVLQHRLVSLALAIQRQGIEPAARARWLARQELPADERERIAVRDDGPTLAARGFAERSPVTGSAGEFRITWPG